MPPFRKMFTGLGNHTDRRVARALEEIARNTRPAPFGMRRVVHPKLGTCLIREPQIPAAPVVVDDEYSQLARKIQGNARAVLVYLGSRGAVCADTARTRDCIVVGLKAGGVPVSNTQVKNAVASLREQGKAVGLDIVESADRGSWLTPAGQRVAALVQKPATVRTDSAPMLNVRRGG